ncbi:MAG: ATP-binding protein, partial [Gammaproteobacteria bacterium]
MMAGKKGVTEFYSPHVKQVMVAGYTQVPELGWGIMVPQPKPEIEKQVENILFSQLSWALLGLVAALGIAVIIARKITNPVNQLAMAAHDVVLNEYEDKLPRITADVPLEIQELNHALVNLVSGLQESHSEIHQLNASLQKRIEDATEQLRISNKQLKLHAEEAQLANKIKSDFLANMSHELRTPLNAIIGYTELLTDEMQDTDDKAYQNDLLKIKKSSYHLLRLINDILDISKLESGRVELSNETIDIKELLLDVEKTLSPLVKEKQNQLDIHFNTTLNTIFADKTKIYQILLNLISNANKFTDNGNIEVEVLDIQSAFHEWIVISVNDSGIGISEEQQKNIFKAFNQANSGISRKYGGTGLGLAISREYAHMMGGDINVESEPGKGATFTLTIPVKS